MGICLSCLRFEDENDDEFNERSSLLRNHNLYSDENLQEELLKQQQRQQELNTIVNDLSDNLIDVSTFLNNPVLTNNTATPNLSYLNHSLQVQLTNEELVSNNLTANTTPSSAQPQNNDSIAKQYPYLLNHDEKLKMLEDIKSLDSSIKTVSKIKSKDSLYLQF